ncbi:hypothetical protein BDY17DRAFT_304280 [Neohortaea acidophila]|uniref:Uncharacterized protein n=1 Tax=Neohortaea acidophila TaxID=245834 RepID=A0A6A6PHW9_9PEZI|nr:uncharacterized protein BDY17DRAFT_304280 [Neohortaea acidophila]KAF2479610.1 hypothetical protein BDY17DRAFT_304280 [Neohortaea acidophila]
MECRASFKSTMRVRIVKAPHACSASCTTRPRRQLGCRSDASRRTSRTLGRLLLGCSRAMVGMQIVREARLVIGLRRLWTRSEKSSSARSSPGVDVSRRWCTSASAVVEDCASTSGILFELTCRELEAFAVYSRAGQNSGNKNTLEALTTAEILAALQEFDMAMRM